MPYGLFKKIEFYGTCRTIICCEPECNRSTDAVCYESFQYYDKIQIAEVLFILKDKEKIKTPYFSVPTPGRLAYFSGNPVCPIHVTARCSLIKKIVVVLLVEIFMVNALTMQGYSIILLRKLVSTA